MAQIHEYKGRQQVLLKQQLTELERLVEIHDFLCVHPFNDGNGRMSRLLTALLLYRAGYHVGKYISLEGKIARNKDLYYNALEASQGGWYENVDNPTPFIKYLLSVILVAYLCPTLGKTSVESSLKRLVDGGVLVKHGKGQATFYTRA